MPIELHKYFIPDPTRKAGKRPSSWRMTEAEAAERGLTEKVPGSREVRGDPYGGQGAAGYRTQSGSRKPD